LDLRFHPPPHDEQHAAVVSGPAPTRSDHDRFCRTEGWVTVRDARGRAVGHHITYELALSDGQVLRTRVSRPPNRKTYGASLWSAILRDQLLVDDATFWACVNEGVLPNRGERRSQPQDPALPVEVVSLLVTKVRLSESEVAAMSKEEAIARLIRFWAEDD
jgi:hypothetical protein